MQNMPMKMFLVECLYNDALTISQKPKYSHLTLVASGDLCWKSQKCLAAYTKKKQILSQFMPEESSNNFIN